MLKASKEITELILNWTVVLASMAGISLLVGGVAVEHDEADAAAIEERSGGTVLKQDVMMLVNGLMAAAGVKGTGYGTRKILDAKKAKAAALGELVGAERLAT